MDATFGQSSLVEEAATGLVPSRPHANRRIGTSSEAPGEGASTRGPRRRGLGEAVSGESENRHFCWGSATGSRANRRFRPRPRSFIPLVLFLGSKQFFRPLLGVPYFRVSDSSPRASGGSVGYSPRGFFETFVSQWLLSGLFYTHDSGGCARAHPPGVAPEALEE